jgi:hypothetical protein
MSGHNPVVGGVTDTRWHLCNGNTVNGIATPNLTGKFIYGGTTAGATGGAATVNLEHAHTNVAEATHTHAAGAITVNAEAAHTHTLAPGTDVSDGGQTYVSKITGAGTSHTHTASGAATGAGASHNHTMNNQLSATQSILPPYYTLCFLARVY